MKRLAFVLSLSLVASAASIATEGIARADDPAPAPAPDSAPTSAATEAATNQPREVPRYDGREPPTTTAGEVALWVPRILLLPLYVVSEFVIRRPLGWLISKAEAEDWPTAVLDFFSFDTQRNSGLVPTAFVDFGFRPSIGLYFFSNGAFAKKNDVRLFATTGGLDWLSFGAIDRYHLWNAPAADGSALSQGTFEMRASFMRRGDQLYYGDGPLSRPDDGGRYGVDRFDVGPGFDLLPTRMLRYRAAAGARVVTYENSCCMDPTVYDRVADNRYPLPPGFGRDYTVGYATNELIFDTRPRRPKAQTGIRMTVHGEHDTDVRGASQSWLKYGAAIGGFVDVTGNERVLGLTLQTEFVDPLAGDPVPFAERVQLGGTGMMRGFRPGRLNGRSGIAATLSYEWPIWAFLDGAMHAALGNAFGAGLRGFDPEILRLSSGIGLRTRNSPDHQFEVLAGFGSEPLHQGFEISQFRLVFGATRGF